MFYLFLEHKKSGIEYVKFYMTLRFIGFAMTVGQIANALANCDHYNGKRCYIPHLWITGAALLVALIHFGHFGYHNWKRYI